jgi:hypothetical protein
MRGRRARITYKRPVFCSIAGVSAQRQSGLGKGLMCVFVVDRGFDPYFEEVFAHGSAGTSASAEVEMQL